MTTGAILTCGAHAQAIHNATTPAMTQTVRCASMLINFTTVERPPTPYTSSIIITTPWCIKFSTCGEWTGGELGVDLLLLYKPMCCRMTVFTFLMDKTQEDTTIEFTGEDPYLQYVRRPQMTTTSSSQSQIIHFYDL